MRERVVGDLVAVALDPLRQFGELLGVAADEKERRLDVEVGQHVEQQRRVDGIRPVVEGQRDQFRPRASGRTAAGRGGSGGRARTGRATRARCASMPRVTIAGMTGARTWTTSRYAAYATRRRARPTVASRGFTSTPKPALGSDRVVAADDHRHVGGGGRRRRGRLRGGCVGHRGRRRGGLCGERVGCRRHGRGRVSTTAPNGSTAGCDRRRAAAPRRARGSASCRSRTCRRWRPTRRRSPSPSAAAATRMPRPGDPAAVLHLDRDVDGTMAATASGSGVGVGTVATAGSRKSFCASLALAASSGTSTSPQHASTLSSTYGT